MLGARALTTGSEVTVSQVREALDGAALLAWARDCRTDLDRRRAEIDALNVFPIADADTGTNLLATMRAAVAAADDVVVADASNATHIVAQALARGATLGARGNSGIILSQVLRGIAEAVRGGPLTGDRLRVALRRGAVLVRTGLSAPVEGTILTVLDRAALAAAASADTTLVTVARAAAEGAARALNETPTQLGVLRAAGVVDAGARGLLVLLDCLVTQISGEAPHRGVYARDRADTGAPTAVARTPARDRAQRAAAPHAANDDTAGATARRRFDDIEAGRTHGGTSDPGHDGVGEPHLGPGARRAGDDRRGDAADRQGIDHGGRGLGGDRNGADSGVEDGQLTGTGEGRADDDRHDRPAGSSERASGFPDGHGDHGSRGGGWFGPSDQAGEPHFEVMYVISGTDEEGADALRDRLAVLGDSVVVVGDGDSTWSAHVHCRDAGAAIEAGIGVGHLTRIRVESFAVTAPHGGGHEHAPAGPSGTHAHAAVTGSPGGVTTDSAGRGGSSAAAVGGGSSDATGGSEPSRGARQARVSDDARAPGTVHRGLPPGTEARVEDRGRDAAHLVGGAGPAADGSSTGGSGPAGGDSTVDRDGPAGGDGPVSGHGPAGGDGSSGGGAGLADRGILAVVAGADAARLFEDAGAVVLRGDRQLDTSALLAAIRAMPHREVLVLPNGALPAQELVAVGVAARDGSRDVLLLPSSSVVQGLAALAVHDRGRIAVDDAFAMSEAAATTRWGALRAASVRALTMVGTCSPGDGLGLVGHDVVVIDPDVVGAGRILLDRMLGLGGELVTLLMGAGAGPELARVLGEHVTAGFPGVEVVVYSGGQQADLVQIGVE